MKEEEDIPMGKNSLLLQPIKVGDLTLKKFIRYETGEGIEKKSENFADEVAKQMAGN